MNDLVSQDEEKDDQNFLLCLVGNVVPCHYYGEEKKIVRGTNLFLANAKVYVYPHIRDNRLSRTQVIGMSRTKKRLVLVRMPVRLITNWRIQKVYNKKIIALMSDDWRWDLSAMGTDRIQNFVKWIEEMTVKERPFSGE